MVEPNDILMNLEENEENLVEWTNEEDDQLMSLIDFKKENMWESCAEAMGKSAEECRIRYISLMTSKTKVRRKPFREWEDAKILELHQKYGPKWAKIAKELKTRTRKQIRERYLNLLDSNTSKKRFNKEEDLTIFKLYSQFGNQWAFISQFIPNRSTDQVRVRFHSYIKKKIDEFVKMTQAAPNAPTDAHPSNSV